MRLLAESKKAYSVSELTRLVRTTLEGAVGTVWVEGEISNLRRQTSGHLYFSLKDSNAQLRCVLFRGAVRSGLEVADGQQVLLFGDLTVYEAQGQYQLIVRSLQPKGLGALQAQFEALKRKLDGEGLFRPERKKPIPRFPRTLALVTSPSSAAIRDMLNILHRRAPWVRILIFPVRVQGDGAADEIAAAIRWICRLESPAVPPIDAVIVGRGGGSIEDLWSFNEEVVARAIADCPIPTVSAVGHEIDFTIADFVADLRAPTPSAAAELVVPDRAELIVSLERYGTRMRHLVRSRVDQGRRIVRLLACNPALRDPARVVGERAQRLDDWEQRLRDAVRRQLQVSRERTAGARRCLELSRPDRLVGQWRERLRQLRHRLAALPPRCLADLRRAVAAQASILRSLGPDSVLRRGYSLTSDARGNVITSVAQVQAGDHLVTRLADGDLQSTVELVASRADPGQAQR